MKKDLPDSRECYRVVAMSPLCSFSPLSRVETLSSSSVEAGSVVEIGVVAVCLTARVEPLAA
jgi:hypothetical protein